MATIVVAAFFPWWGLGGFNPFFLWSLMGWLIAASFVLRSVWKPTRIVDPTPTRREQSAERLRARHPLLALEIRLDRNARVAVLGIAIVMAVIAWISLDDPSRYVWAVIAIVSGVAISLARWNDL